LANLIDNDAVDRRRFLRIFGGVALACLAPLPLAASITGSGTLGAPLPAEAALSGAGIPGAPGAHLISLLNINTGERLACAYREKGILVPDATAAIDHLLRDHRNNEIKPIDPQLLDLLHDAASALGATEPFQVVCGYRSPATNAAMRRRGAGVAKHSYHINGRAVDVSLPGVQLSQLRLAARDLKTGGVGYYPGAHFVHLDTGPVRSW
jgi:uncharacterized protein YcbK (DUF882 family)